jgi:hypothetical protein
MFRLWCCHFKEVVARSSNFCCGDCSSGGLISGACITYLVTREVADQVSKICQSVRDVRDTANAVRDIIATDGMQKILVSAAAPDNPKAIRWTPQDVSTCLLSINQGIASIKQIMDSQSVGMLITRLPIETLAATPRVQALGTETPAPLALTNGMIDASRTNSPCPTPALRGGITSRLAVPRTDLTPRFRRRHQHSVSDVSDVDTITDLDGDVFSDPDHEIQAEQELLESRFQKAERELDAAISMFVNTID